MTIILIIMAVLQALSTLLTFFVTLSSNILLAFLSLAIGIGGVALYIAVIRNWSCIDDLYAELHYWQSRVRRLENDQQEDPEPIEPPAVHKKETARKPWTCPKCKSVNKPGTTACESCGAHFSSWFES